MEFGALFITDPPIDNIVDMAHKAEESGFDYFLLPDSQVLWQDPWPIFALIGRETERVRLGPCVTNPGTRDWTVLASGLAVLDEISDGRMVCGIGRGDSALRTINRKPVKMKELEDCINVVNGLVEGREVPYNDSTIKIPWTKGRHVPMWGAGYGPKALELIGRLCDGFVLQIADPDILRWTLAHVHASAEAAGRDPKDIKVVVSAPAYVSSDLDHAEQQLRYFGGAVGNHVVDLIKNHGIEGLPPVLTEYVKNRPGYDYAKHGRTGNPLTDYVPREITERFTVMGDVDAHVRKLLELRDIGADVFNIYFQSDDNLGTMKAYADEVIPAMR